MTPSEMDVYRRPFLNYGKDIRPSLPWPCQISIEGKPKDVLEIVTAYGKWLSKSDIPKLFKCRTRSNFGGQGARFLQDLAPNQEEGTVKGIHFIQEDSPDQIGPSIAKFFRKTNVK